MSEAFVTPEFAKLIRDLKRDYRVWHLFLVLDYSVMALNLGIPLINALAAWGCESWALFPCTAPVSLAIAALTFSAARKSARRCVHLRHAIRHTTALTVIEPWRDTAMEHHFDQAEAAIREL